MKNPIGKVEKFTTTKTVTFSFILFFINALWLTLAGKKLDTFSSYSKLDFQISGYNTSKVLKIFHEYGEEGRAYYLWMTLLDIPFPFLVGAFGVLYFTFTWRKWKYFWLGNLLIICSLSFFIFDNLENIFILKMLGDYPNITNTDSTISSISTQIKLLSLLIIYIFIPITVIISLFRIFNKK